MNIKEIRDAIIRKQTMYEATEQRRLKAYERIEELSRNITDEMFENLLSVGIDISFIRNIKKDKFMNDKEYREKFISKYNNVINKLESDLESFIKEANL